MPEFSVRRNLTLRVLCAIAFLTLTACGGGGGGNDAVEDTELQPPAPSYAPGDDLDSSDGNTPASGSGESENPLNPGEYAQLTSCTPFTGNNEAPFKVLFANLDSAPFFNEIVQDAVTNQFRALTPFSEFQSQFAFYEIDLQGFSALGCSHKDKGGFSCDTEQVHRAILEQCASDDIHGTLKVVIGESDYGASGGEIIYVASDRDWLNIETTLHQLRNIIIHEIGHNFGLADLYDSPISKDGISAEGWPSKLSREWANLDGPGCSKWCNSFKPASEYVQSANATCPTLTDRESCTSYNRTTDGTCETDENGNYSCCGWSEDTVDDYFGSQCTPAWGSENIGQDCLQGTGCYYGGAHGNNSWRPVKTWEDSIMYGAGHSQSFDAVSEQALREAIRCCGTSDDSTESCAVFRADYNTFLLDYQPFKNRLGSCGTF
ncbi:hypothetical protein [Microbulbifer sp. HZ11]|uniref:hypothetical protein n=1 Tax=Microbulbifer sp. HZ11 TaxID=1453501 RepID=UPI0005B89A0D|nr:hypothetical protein [Microbulbifer sp. HZ11]